MDSMMSRKKRRTSAHKLNQSPAMSNKFSSAFHDTLLQLSEPVRESLSRTEYKPPETTNVSIKLILQTLLPNKTSDTRTELINFSLCCALLSSAAAAAEASTTASDLLAWIPNRLSAAASLAFRELSKAYFSDSDVEKSKRVGELGLDCSLMPEEKQLVIELMFDVLPLLKDAIKESSIDKLDDGDEVSAASARVPVGYAVMAAYQFRWFVTQVDYPHLGKLCFLVIPCALTVLDHWSSEVKGQGMTSFIHLAKNVNAAELGVYEDVILDTCCQNIASSDEIWHLVVEMSVLVVTCTQWSNPRSIWYERLLNEMLSHLERQPRNKERRVAWLELIEPLFNGMGLVLLAHFKHIFPLLFQWMHADDDQTVIQALKRVHTVIKLTWIRNTPYVERPHGIQNGVTSSAISPILVRGILSLVSGTSWDLERCYFSEQYLTVRLVDELAVIYKEASLRKAREEIRTNVLQTLSLLQQCKGLQFETAWEKYKDDPNLTTLGPSFNGKAATVV